MLSPIVRPQRFNLLEASDSFATYPRHQPFPPFQAAVVNGRKEGVGGSRGNEPVPQLHVGLPLRASGLRKPGLQLQYFIGPRTTRAQHQQDGQCAGFHRARTTTFHQPLFPRQTALSSKIRVWASTETAARSRPLPERGVEEHLPAARGKAPAIRSD